jgi:hypothetical protein
MDSGFRGFVIPRKIADATLSATAIDIAILPELNATLEIRSRFRMPCHISEVRISHAVPGGPVVQRAAITMGKPGIKATSGARKTVLSKKKR